MEAQLYDINTVCKMLGITSRSLRFWEEKGIICKAQIVSGRRKYTSEQIDAVKKVIALRTVGLSVKDIQALQKNEIELRDAISERRAALIASVEKKERELSMLYDALSVIDGGGDLYGTEKFPTVAGDEKYKEYAARCAEAVIYGNDKVLYSYFSDRLRAYLPPEVYRRAREDTLKPLGKFEQSGETVTDGLCKNVVLHYAKYEKLGLRMKFVFHGEKLEGLWLTYYEI